MTEFKAVHDLVDSEFLKTLRCDWWLQYLVSDLPEGDKGSWRLGGLDKPTRRYKKVDCILLEANVRRCWVVGTCCLHLRSMFLHTRHCSVLGVDGGRGILDKVS